MYIYCYFDFEIIYMNIIQYNLERLKKNTVCIFMFWLLGD